MKNKIIIFLVLASFNGFSQITRTLSNVTNTADSMKPVSVAQKAAIVQKLQTVSTISALQGFTDATIAQFDGSTWNKISGNVASNGGAFAGTIVNVSASFYWQRNTNVPTPQMFGAISNDLIDDTPALQNWINANTSNKKLILPEGNFITTELTIPSNTILSGAGKSSSITVSGVGNAINLTTLNGIQIENISFIGNNGSTSTLNGNGILVQNSTFITISGCSFTGFGSAADTGAGGIFITGTSSDCSVFNNYITGGLGGVQGSDIVVFSNSGKVFISGNKCYSSGNSNGINVNTVNPLGNIIVTGNFCDNHLRHGIICAYSGTTQIENSIISNNICTNNASTGIYCNTDTHGFIITGNIIESCSGGGRNGYDICGGISVIGNGSKIVSNNYISNTGKTLAGVVRTIDPTNATGDANDPTRCTAIRNNASKNTIISNNIINGSTGSGITLYLKILQASINNNQIDNCVKYAIITNATGIANQTKIDIKDNLINQSVSDGHGIYLLTYLIEDNVDISGNYIKGAKLATSKYGLHIEGMGAKGKIFKNFINNFDTGFDTQATNVLQYLGKSLFFDSNTISNCTKGMYYLTSSTQYNFHTNTYYENNTQNEHDPYAYGTFVSAISIIPQKNIQLTAIPTFGAWNLGDRIINKTPIVGQPKSWVCTVAGTPGTWVSEGNL